MPNTGFNSQVHQTKDLMVWSSPNKSFQTWVSKINESNAESLKDDSLSLKSSTDLQGHQIKSQSLRQPIWKELNTLISNFCLIYASTCRTLINVKF